MSTLTKKQWTSWMRWSILAFIVHVIILGLIYDWNLFSFYQRNIVLFSGSSDILWELSQDISFDYFYPRIFDALTIPAVSLVIFLFCKNLQKYRGDDNDFIDVGIFLGFVGVVIFCSVGLNLGLIQISILGFLISLITTGFGFCIDVAIGFEFISVLFFGLVFGLVFGFISMTSFILGFILGFGFRSVLFFVYRYIKLV